MKASAHIPSNLQQVVKENGYSEVRDVAGQGRCGLLPFAYAWTIVVGLTPDCYGRRYCFEHQGDASQAFAAWTGQANPSGPWIKCKGAGIDLLNPALELI
ncbi:MULTISPECIES: hypothetical protein [unclassified Polaromonas]|jgi:hypothetical protein|uniref:hypothetical protein n=1 Tax=unclassified Polaromonas TaxID=2638319 RepID=UPI000BC6F98C|nr:MULTISPECIES: hypothetical protein [unclassified Polaromonas]OYY33399.1 MAG: hypothetical protein B7Y60_19440 [Polaromonas sp. 35-63-35]OYZ18333.1 MAG: hypothetical protein B7Y28_16675 [Polaromonas sp. 16-63-31]OYZ77007.1 MAG: hypothetical protein B7Y09_17985 [Polaromonas sp. 24-63-21]OZA48036.1 MAG: hypothetical protein B7X88_19600 [Polaromonas sp. 17-63-33]OZA86299.1 MAG: hypothetical protein B7X65_17525 [Polaromonas sp. 39-63-25]